MTVQTGLARLASEGSSLIADRRVGLVCNATSVDAELRPAIELLRARRDVKLTALFGPEHGVRGDAQDMIGVNTATDAHRLAGPQPLGSHRGVARFRVQ